MNCPKFLPPRDPTGNVSHVRPLLNSGWSLSGGRNATRAVRVARKTEGSRGPALGGLFTYMGRGLAVWPVREI